jgi:hypothetical protein
MSGSVNNGYFTAGMADMALALSSANRFGGDTNLSGEASPQVAAFSPTQLASGVFVVSVPLTGFAITIGAGVSQYLINPAGTLATGTFTMPEAPQEGQELSIGSTQTQTAVTFTANTGQTFAVAAPSALVAKVSVKFRYLSTVWYQV